MGLDPKDFAMGGYDDPELAALDKQLQKQNRGEFDEEDPDDMLADLDKELGGLGLAGQQAADESSEEEPDPTIHQRELEALSLQHKRKALDAKKAGDKDTALKFLKEMKKVDAELTDWLVMHPPGSWQPKPKKRAVPAQQ